MKEGLHQCIGGDGQCGYRGWGEIKRVKITGQWIVVLLLAGLMGGRLPFAAEQGEGLASKPRGKETITRVKKVPQQPGQLAGMGGGFFLTAFGQSRVAASGERVGNTPLPITTYEGAKHYWGDWLAIVAGAVPEGEREIEIDVSRRRLTLFINGKEYIHFPVAVGTSKTPSPIGEFKIVHKGKNWGGGFGTRWLGLNVPWGIYGIHGTNKPGSIGSYVSHGCIRMFNHHVEKLYALVPYGTRVRLVGRSPGPIRRILQRGTTGQDVVALQLALRQAGYDAGYADGRYGQQTAAAVAQLQADYGLLPDGQGWPDVYLLLGVD